MCLLPDSNWYFHISEQIGSKCASLLLILLISVLLQILVISRLAANNIIQSLHGRESKSFTTALPFKLKRFIVEQTGIEPVSPNLQSVALTRLCYYSIFNLMTYTTRVKILYANSYITDLFVNSTVPISTSRDGKPAPQGS